MSLLFRRLVTVIAVAGAIVVGAVSIEAAAAAVRASEPPLGPSVAVESIQAELALERERSRVLQDQLDRLLSQADMLSASLAEADARVSADAATAEQLRTDLATARRQLAKLKRQMAAARVTTQSSGGSASSRSSGGEDHHEEDHEDEQKAEDQEDPEDGS